VSQRAKRFFLLVSTFLTASLVIVSVSLQNASAAPTTTVSTNPADFTPQLASANSTVIQLVQCNKTMYAVGDFSSIKQGSKTYARNNAFSFDATTGAVSSWNPNVNGVVNSVTVSPDCANVYLGGKFSTVHGTSVQNLAEVNASTGTVVTAFAHSASGEVQTVLYTHSHVIIGGKFTGINGTSSAHFVSVNPTTGKVDSYLNLPVSGVYGTNSSTRIANLEISHDGSRLLAMGVFTSVGGQARQQIFMLDLGATSATLSPWSSPEFLKSCAGGLPYYLQAASWSPDDKKIYVATTGYQGESSLCDAAAAFSSTASSDLMPLWINKTGGDSLYATAADANNVYIGGHERYADNPQGSDSCGVGCVSRPGVGDISPSTGKATSWNPTRDRGHGADDMVLTSAGLWIASDNFYNSVKCGNEVHAGICFFPY
jgi:hypothetical protein